MIDKILYVFTNSRKIRDFNAKFSDELIPKAITVADFERNAVFVPNRFEADDAYLVVLMQRACAAVREANIVLKIPNEFFAFLKNNEYLFSFFKELSIQNKQISDIKFSDIYADFEEHLNILDTILTQYKALLENEKIYDDITLPYLYELNSDYISDFSEIILEIDGFLSEFEWELMSKVASLTTLKIIFKTSKFNKKMTQKLAQISNINFDEFEQNSKFELNLTTKTLKKLQSLEHKNIIQTRGFALGSLQCAYAMAKVSEFVSDGIEPERIALILPDESFAEILRLYDTQRMFNFAMGESFKHTKFFQILSYIIRAIDEDKTPVFDEKDEDYYDEISFALRSFGVSVELFYKFKNNYESACAFEFFKSLISEILNLQSELHIDEKIAEQMFMLQNLSRYFDFSLRQICEIFLMGLRRLSVDDVSGGKVSVMGLLESRGMSFDGVIIIDFNDDLIPKRSVSEMFLNSRVREKAGLIGYNDRENLQRFYYESLINGAKKVAISYVSNEEKIVSRFLKEFDTILDTKFSDGSYERLLGGGSTGINLKSNEIILKHNFFEKALSFSTLDRFLSCPRKYYYKNIMGIKEPKSINDEPTSKLGEALHAALCEYYTKFDRFYLDKFSKILKNYTILPLDYEILMVKFREFECNENAHFDDGYKVLECEKNIENTFCGVNIVGRIDRIDVRGDELCLIDYKSGKFDTKSLQLPFYQALLGRECESYFYDLCDEMKLVPSTLSLKELQNEIEKLKSINNTEINFEQNISQSCRYCEYKIICKGEL
ncbi:PD-(D/E)XK nuclease family protein [Campylobacter sp. faydin G-105]|uniref:PD-(D/E)XK nuclease family protein n=1 Tax=Campylobacter anatolicus TaxID=2829105 RepID=UPI001BA1CA95|nr:PD-(D/E)XK nuclease family protein [Campylobacter anatolicus]MBR8461749.1 PD-(D/E)XK nuclease family protein [Campylobacter anatolicus]